MRILFIGDVFGALGRRILAATLPALREELKADLCIANGENVAGGLGITSAIAGKFHRYGVDVITGGNHSFDNPDAAAGLESDPMFLRPHNFPPGNIGRGIAVARPEGLPAVGVINLQGRIFMDEAVDCPFRSAREAVREVSRTTPVIIVDFHAEATSEKKGLALFLDGSISSLIGTHTHVQTADESILPGGTSFITDVGMTGPEDSIIGMEKEAVLRKFLLQTKTKFRISDAGPLLNGVVLDIDESSGKTVRIRRLYRKVAFP